MRWILLIAAAGALRAETTVCELFAKLDSHDGERVTVTGELLIGKNLLALGASECDHKYNGALKILPVAIALRPTQDVGVNARAELRELGLNAERLRASKKRVLATAKVSGRLKVDSYSESFAAELAFDSVEDLKIAALPDASTLPVVPICELFQNLEAWRGKRVAVRGQGGGSDEGFWITGDCKGSFVTNGYRWPVALTFGGPAYFSRETEAITKADIPPKRKGEIATRGRHDVVETATYVGVLRMRTKYEATCTGRYHVQANGFGHLNAAPAELVVDAIRDVVIAPRSARDEGSDHDDAVCEPPNRAQVCESGDVFTALVLNGCAERIAVVARERRLDLTNDWELLDYAIRNGESEVAEVLIREGASLTIGPTELWSPLGEAAHFGRIKVMKAMLKAGADPEAKDKWGVSFLPSYGYFNSRVARTLLDGGASINARDSQGRTALMGASEHGYEETIRLLIERGADVNLRDDQGRTALMYAASGKYVDAIPLLLQKHADLYAKDRSGQTALDIARKSKNIVAVEMLSAAMKN